MQSTEENLRRSIIVGWINLLQLIVVMFLVSLVRSAIANDFTSFGKDPGNLGLDIMIVIFSIYAVMPVLVKMFDARAFRWLLVGVSIFFLLLFIAHQITHMVVDKMPLNIYHLLDFSHHLIMVWVIFCTIQWARLAEVAAPVRSRKLA